MDFIRFVPLPAWQGDFVQIAPSINTQANAARVPPCGLAAIVMRESAGQNIFQYGVPHDSPDCGCGYCQITFGVDRTNPDQPKFLYGGQNYDLMNGDSNLLVAAQAFLAPAISSMLHLRQQIGMAKMPEQIMYYAFAVYNAGATAVSQAVVAGGNVDAVTTDNYASGTYALYNQALAFAHAQSP
jgi:hypothetical protein